MLTHGWGVTIYHRNSQVPLRLEEDSDRTGHMTGIPCVLHFSGGLVTQPNTLHSTSHRKRQKEGLL